MPSPKSSKTRRPAKKAAGSKAKRAAKRPVGGRRSAVRAAKARSSSTKPAPKSRKSHPSRARASAKRPARTIAKAPAPASKPATARRPKAAPLPVAPAVLPAAAEPAVLVIGDHPAASLCALLLKEAKVPVTLIDTGSTPNADRLITLNPALFGLHKSLEQIRPMLSLAPVTYARFLGPGGESAQTQPSGDEPIAFIASMTQIRQSMRELAIEAGVPQIRAHLAADNVDERGVHMRIDGAKSLPRILAVADPLPEELALLLDVPRFPGRGSFVQATARLRGDQLFMTSANEHALPLTLDLGRQLNWGWLLRLGDEAQLCVQCPPEGDVPALLEEWVQMLRAQQIISPQAQPDLSTVKTYDLPLAGALMRDVVARRTLLLGPAGGFYSASGEDVYPGCWSAKYAAEIAARAVKADHPQDALGAYRGRWGATLGDYLRGPQQNLRFLLPLVYKNPVMTQRLAEAILLGQSLVK